MQRSFATEFQKDSTQIILDRNNLRNSTLPKHDRDLTRFLKQLSGCQAQDVRIVSKLNVKVSSEC